MNEPADNPNFFQRLRAEMDREAAQLEAAAKLAWVRGDLMPGRIRREQRTRHRLRQYNARLQLAGVGVLSPERSDNGFLESQRPKLYATNDGTVVSWNTADPESYSEVSHWLNKAAWNMRMCGRTAVGVGVLRKVCELPGEKVYCATCKDRDCPACEAQRMAHFVPALKTLITEQFTAGERLFFATLTVKHKYSDTLKSTREVLDRSWARLIRSKWFKDTFGDRLRVQEIEFTKKAGFHPHFHLLLQLRRDCKAWHWPRADVYTKLLELWTRCTERCGRRSWKVDLRELVAVRNPAGEIECIRYWLRPEERAKFEKLEALGAVKLYRRGEHLSREQTLEDVIKELCKYVTKRHADGVKTNQIPKDRWKNWMTLEYRVGVRYWHRHCFSNRWEQRLMELNEASELQREIEADEAGGYEYFPWAGIVAWCRRAAVHELNQDEAERFAADYPRILAALDRAGCDVAADMIRGYIFRFFGDSTAPLKQLRVRPWEKREWQEENQAQLIADAQAQQRLKARHWRVLLRLRRRHDLGDENVRLSGLGMSRRRLGKCVEDLERDGLLSTAVDDKGKSKHALTEHGRRLIPTRIPDPRKKHAQIKALRELQKLIPGMLFVEPPDG